MATDDLAGNNVESASYVITRAKNRPTNIESTPYQRKWAWEHDCPPVSITL